MAELIVVTPNPAVDVTYHVPAYEVGSTVRVSEVARRPGGKGLNVVRVLRTLGATAVSVLPLGGSAGQWISTMMDAHGQSAEIVTVRGETRTTVAVVGPDTHPTLFSEAGPELSADEGDRLIAAAVKHCEPGSVLVVSGSLPLGTGPAWLGRLVTEARSAGARVLVDTSGPALIAAAEAGADLLKPNAAEAIEAVAGDVRAGIRGAHPAATPPSVSDNRPSRRRAQGVPSVGEQAPESLAEAEAELEGAVAYLRGLGAGAVVVSRGADGIVGFAGGEAVRQRAVSGVTGNPTGAGDAATAGLALAWARGESLSYALRRAAVLGAAAVRRPTAGEVDPADVREFEEQLTKDET